MSAPADLRSTCDAICTVLADAGSATSWRVRLHAAEMLITQFTDASVEVLVVRAIAYGRAATLRLGGAMLPTSDAERAHIREQVGPAMLALGYDDHHAVLVVNGQLIMDVASWHDHHDPGVLLYPYVAELDLAAPAPVVIEGLPYGVAIVYDAVPATTLAMLTREHRRLVHELAASAAPRVRWRLDSPPTLTERSA